MSQRLGYSLGMLFLRTPAGKHWLERQAGCPLSATEYANTLNALKQMRAQRYPRARDKLVR